MQIPLLLVVPVCSFVQIRFYLISRRQGNTVLPTQYMANACFTFHFVNCYEDGDYLVVDLASYDNMNIVNELSVSNVTTNHGDVATAVLRRYVLPLNIEKVCTVTTETWMLFNKRFFLVFVIHCMYDVVHKI